MVRLGHILAIVAIISLIVPLGCAQEPKPDVYLVDPCEELA